jgi:hypothetical protein
MRHGSRSFWSHRWGGQGRRGVGSAAAVRSRGAEKMQNDTNGVDISKDHLDVHRLADGASRRFANDRGGHKALIKWVVWRP